MLLSVIIPFFNTFDRSEQIRKVITHGLNHCDNIEFILVDDGSTNLTFIDLKKYFEKYSNNQNIKIVTQDNNGPGSARNNGLNLATGEYVWFVDSDDSIALDVAIQELKKYKNNGYTFDFIDFDIYSNGKKHNSMKLAPNYYGKQYDMYIHLGRLVTKIFNRNFLIDNKIKYFEQCFYEDNYLIFILPLYINSFIKSDKLGYFHNTDCDSITRGKFSRKFYDRLLTAYHGLDFNYQQDSKIPVGCLIKFYDIFFKITYNHVTKGIQSKNIDESEYKNIIKCFEWLNYIEKKYNIKYVDNIKKTKLKKQIKMFKLRRLAKSYQARDNLKYFTSMNENEWKVP